MSEHTKIIVNGKEEEKPIRKVRLPREVDWEAIVVEKRKQETGTK